jgi:hypothetical protein
VIAVPWSTQLRSSLAAWLTLLLVPALVMYASGNLLRFATAGYWQSSSAQAAFLLFMIAPAGALAGAWEGGRVRRGGVERGAPVRSALRIGIVHLLPVFAMVTVAIAAAFAVTSTTAAGAPGFPNPWMVLDCLAVGFSHAVLGYAAGRILPITVSLPLSLAVSYVWTAYVSTVEPFWLRHLTGMHLNDCCSLDQVPAPGALAAPIIMAAGLATAGLLLVVIRNPAKAAPAAVGTVVLGFFLAALPVHHLGPLPVEARTGTVCKGSAPRICLWPEQQHAAARIRSTLTTDYHRLTQAGLHLPATIDAADNARQHGALNFGSITDPTDQQITDALSLGVLPEGIPACAATDPYPGFAAWGPLQVWLDLVQGSAAQQLEGQYIPADVQIARQVRTLPRDAQLHWFATNVKAVSTCTAQPELHVAAPGKGGQE